MNKKYIFGAASIFGCVGVITAMHFNDYRESSPDGRSNVTETVVNFKKDMTPAKQGYIGLTDHVKNMTSMSDSSRNNQKTVQSKVDDYLIQPIYSSLDEVYENLNHLVDTKNFNHLIEGASKLGLVDPQTQELLIGQYLIDPHSHEADLIFEVIKHVQGSKVQELSYLLLDSGEKGDLLAALELAANQNNPQRELLQSVTDTMMENLNDEDVILGALDVFSEAPVLSDINDPDLLRSLESLTTHDNELIREASLISIGRLAQSNEDLVFLTRKLDTDEKIDGLVGLSASSFKSHEVQNLLLNIITDLSEDSEIRYLAALGLDKYTLPREYYDEWVQLRQMYD